MTRVMRMPVQGGRWEKIWIDFHDLPPAWRARAGNLVIGYFNYYRKPIDGRMHIDFHWDNITLEHVPNPRKAMGWAADPAVVTVNQLGYKTAGSKLAILPASSAAQRYYLRRSDSHEVVMQGGLVQTSSRMGDFLEADFSSWTEPGQYYVQAGNVRSLDFPIADHPYRQAAQATLDILKGQRYGPATSLHPQSHQDTVWDPESNKHIDLVGGYFDAGDLRQFNHNAMMQSRVHMILRNMLAKDDPMRQELLDESLWCALLAEKHYNAFGYFTKGVRMRNIRDGNYFTDNKIGTADDYVVDSRHQPYGQWIIPVLAELAMQIKADNPQQSQKYLEIAQTWWKKYGGESYRSSMALYRATGEQKYLDQAHLQVSQLLRSFDPRVLEHTRRPLGGIFYDNPHQKSNINYAVERTYGDRLEQLVCIMEDLLYVDGQEVSTRDQRGRRPAQPDPLRTERGIMGVVVGAAAPWSASSTGFRGLIDNVRVQRGLPADMPAAEGPLPDATTISLPVPAQASFHPDDAASQQQLELRPEQTRIVVPARMPMESELQAARLLQRELRRICNTQTGFDLVNEIRFAQQSGEGQVVLAVGATGFTQGLQPPGGADGFALQRRGNVLVIHGSSPVGTLLGVVYFLDHYIGVRFYLPGELFTSTPAAQAPPRIGHIDQVIEPGMTRCFATGFHNLAGENEWAKYQGLIRSDGSHQHNMWERFPADKFAKTHPEIYPILDGKRYIPTGPGDQAWQPRFHEPALAQIAQEVTSEYFRLNPHATYIAYSIQDGHRFSEDLAQDARYAGMDKLARQSQSYWAFIREHAKWMKQHHPEKFIVGLAYAGVRQAPDFDLPDNVIVWMVYKLSDIENDRRFSSDADGSSPAAWAKKASIFGQHDWVLGKGYLIPRLYTHHIQQALQSHEALGATVRFAHAECYPNWGLDGPKLYLMGQLWLNPNADVDALLRQFCDDMFGQASAPMYEYFDGLHALWDSLSAQGERKRFPRVPQFVTTPEQLKHVAHLTMLLDQAHEAATTPQEKQRIDLFRKSFKLSSMLMALTAASTVSDADLERVRAYAQELTTDPMTIYQGLAPGDAMKQVEEALASIRKFKPRP